MKIMSDRKYVRAAVLPVLTGIILALLSACGGVPLRVVGEEHQLTVEKKHGNIAGKTAKTSKERVAVLSETIRDRKGELGGKGISDADLAFLPYAESTFILPNGQTHVLTVLYQAHKGARVLEGLQYGSFDRDTGELRAVRAVLKDPSRLPSPPAQDAAVWSRMHEVFRNYLQKSSNGEANFIIEEQPVISASAGVSGYLARYSRRNPDGSLSRFAALIEPGSESVHVLYDINTD